jgi:hypothetical protein
VKKFDKNPEEVLSHLEESIRARLSEEVGLSAEKLLTLLKEGFPALKNL